MRFRDLSRALVLAFLGAGCSRACGNDAPSTVSDASVGDAATGDAAVNDAAAALASALPAGAAIFSLPIAAAHDPVAGRSFVAGLRAADKTITLTLVDEQGVEAFRRDVFTGVGWSSDAELRVYAASHGAWVVWRGPVDGGRTQRAIFVNDDGVAVSAGTDVAPAHCAIGDVLSVVHGGAVVMVAPDGGVRRLRLADPTADFSLMCDDGRILVMSESEDGVFVEVPEDGGLRRLSAFNAYSEGRTTALYSHGDRAGILRIGGRDATLRELTDGGLSRPRSRRLAIDEDDDIVVVDAVGIGPLLVTTHEAEGTCDGGVALAPRVLAALVSRASASTDAGADTGPDASADGGAPLSIAELAPPVCGRERGPFWSGAAGSDVIVAWGERIRQVGKSAAPVAAVGFARIRADGTVADRGIIDLSADAVVDASCDAHDCYAAALLRPAGDDDQKPEAVRVFPLRSSQTR